HGLAARRAMLDARARPQHAHVVGELRDGPDRRARIRGRTLLLDGDRRGEAPEPFHGRPVEPAEELPRICGERLHVATLALGVERVEGKAALARPARPREYYERVLRQK